MTLPGSYDTIRKQREERMAVQLNKEVQAMADHELLLAISNMLDTKLKAEFQALRMELHEGIQALGTELHEEIQAVRTELHEEIQAVRAELYGEIQSVRAEVQDLRAELQEVKADVQTLKAEVQTLKAEVQTLKDEVQTLKDEMHRIKLYQENVIMPRINTIEACYTDTFKRYAMYVEKMESTFQDVEMLKIVVAEHSEKLKKLA